MSLLSLLGASQSAVESSDQALKAAEKALTAAQTANKQAKEMLRAVTEAFVQEDRKQAVSTNNERPLQERKEVTARRISIMDCESDGDSNEDFEDALEDFLMLSTNKNPVNDIDDDDTTEDEDSSGDKYLLVSSSGPAGDHWGYLLGLFRKSEDTREGRSVYIQENNTHYGRSPAELFSDQGVWSIKWSDSVFLRASTPSTSPKSVTWQYVEDCMKTWRDDPALILHS